MFISGKKIRALRDKKKYSNSCVVRKFVLNETKNHNPPPPPPLRLKWSVPYSICTFLCSSFSTILVFLLCYWPFYCAPYFEIRLLITTLVS